MSFRLFDTRTTSSLAQDASGLLAFDYGADKIEVVPDAAGLYEVRLNDVGDLARYGSDTSGDLVQEIEAPVRTIRIVNKDSSARTFTVNAWRYDAESVIPGLVDPEGTNVPAKLAVNVVDGRSYEPPFKNFTHWYSHRI